MIALIISVGTIPSCASGNENSRANDKASDGRATPGQRANDEKSPDNKPTETKEFSKAKGSGSGDDFASFAKWNFTDGADEYELTSNGHGKRTDNERRVTDFRLPLRDTEVVDNSLYFTKYKTDLLILYGTSVAGSGAGYLVRFDVLTLKPKWNADIIGSNISQGLVENQFAYLGSNGFVAKIDLDTGKYVWKHDDLYRKYNKDAAFNTLETPEIREDTVIFTEKQDNLPLNSIVLDKKSGKIIKVNIGIGKVQEPTKKTNLSGEYFYRYTKDYGGEISFVFKDKNEVDYEWRQEDITWKGAGTSSWNEIKQTLTATVFVEPDVSSAAESENTPARKDVFVFQKAGNDLKLTSPPQGMDAYQGKVFQKR